MSGAATPAELGPGERHRAHPHEPLPPLSDPGKDERAAEGVPVVPAFDGYRALAIMAIVLFHVSVESGVLASAGDSLGGQLIWATGPQLVDILFVVSGFVVFLPTVAQRGEFGNVPNYAIRRGARLLPAFWLSLLVMLLIMATAPGVALPGAGGLLSNFSGQMTLVEMVNPAIPVGFGRDTPIWTLTLEIGFYVVLPFIAGAYYRRPFVGLAIALAIALLWREAFANIGHIAGWFGYELSLERAVELQFHSVSQLPSWAFSFAAGMTGAWVYVRLRRDLDPERLQRLAIRALVPSALLFALFVFLVGRETIGTTFPDGLLPNVEVRQSAFLSIGYTASLAATMVALALAPRRLQNPFALPLARKLGDISYGVYLIQAPILWLLIFHADLPTDGALGAFAIWLLAVVPASLLYGYLSARFLEQPIRRWARRFGRAAQAGSIAPPGTPALAGASATGGDLAVAEPARPGATELRASVGAAGVAERASAVPVAIEVRGLEKAFRIPTHRVDSFKERALHPLARSEYRELRALQEVSFDIHRGEFFGIVGKNGSGKSTLLKVLASIYRADAGSIRMAGRIAPFIELGVGFDSELTARENVVMNGVMMGLTRAEARGRFDAVLEFAELEDFADLKLKNYSSGMLVRLAFSVMVQADADILLIDEVLAVGDAAFQRKCGDTFREMHAAGKTVVLVTHDMQAINSYCDRAMLVHEGELRYVGDPQEVGRRYYRQNFSGVREPWGRKERGVPDLHAALVEARLEGPAGGAAATVRTGATIKLEVVLEARHDLLGAEFGFECRNAEGTTVFGFKRSLEGAQGEPPRLGAGDRVSISAAIENTLMPGTYYLRCWVVRDLEHEEIALQFIDVLKFDVVGDASGPGLVSVPAEVSITTEQKGAR